MPRYLVAVDGSVPSRYAFNRGFALFRPDDEVLLAYVTDLEPYLKLFKQRDAKDFVEANQKMMEDAEALLSDYELQCAKANIPTKRVVVTEGSPAEKLCALVEQREVQVLVLGSRGVSFMQTFLWGSVSEYCLRNAKCGVLIFRDNAAPKTPPPTPPTTH